MMDRRSILQILGHLPLLTASGFPLLPAHAAAVTDLGILTPFYRSTQLQGHLIGMGLMKIPDYLEAPDVGLKYRRNPGLREEIPFVDSFTINRFLGGYREDWLRKFKLLEARLGRRSLDYVVKKPNGSLEFRPHLIRRRLQPYLSAGYRPAHITLVLENVPWDLEAPGRRAPEEGTWGRRSPPANLDEWSQVIRQFASDLKALLGSTTAETMHFETGVEYDERASFNASALQFFRFYEATDRALHSILPAATLNPGEFTGFGICTPRQSDCVYDTASFINFARQQHLHIRDLPRSLHSFLDRPATVWPSAAAKRALVSYHRLPSVVAEIHQFGVLDEPFGRGASDCAAIQANWEFQVLMRLWASLKPRRVFHWGCFVTVGKKLALLNGAGFLRLVLDQYLGRRAHLLSPIGKESAGGARAEVMAIALVSGDKSAVLLSSFSIEPAGAPREVILDLPPPLPSVGRLQKIIRYRQSANVFVQIRADLAQDGNLKQEFADCRSCLAPPIQMARDANRARAMLLRNSQRYVAAIKDSLRWGAINQGILSGSRLRIAMEPNEFVVIE
jgi:hypothetical protein